MMTAPQIALRGHWPEYLIEGWALGSFMVSAGIVPTLLGAPASPVHRALSNPLWRNAAGGVAMGATAVALIHSAWGKRSGAHMNPAVTLTFLRLGKIRPWDALFFVIAQLLGGTAGVLVVVALAGHAFSDPPVSYAATLPGSAGPAVAFVAEQRLLPAAREHRAFTRALQGALARAGMVSFTRRIGLNGTAHACGSLLCGLSAVDSVVDREARVHGMQGLYVVDGSVLPRSNRVNPSLTIYAWGLRAGQLVARQFEDASARAKQAVADVHYAR